MARGCVGDTLHKIGRRSRLQKAQRGVYRGAEWGMLPHSGMRRVEANDRRGTATVYDREAANSLAAIQP